MKVNSFTPLGGRWMDWKQTFIYPWYNLEGIFIIDFSKHRIRKIQSVHFPMSMPLAVIVKILVRSFQFPEVGIVLLFFVGILSHHHAILVADHPRPRKSGVSS